MQFPKILEQLERQMKSAQEKKYSVEVGWFETELAKIARINEYGAVINVTPKMRGFLSAAYGIHLKKDTTQIIIPPRTHRQQTIHKHLFEWKTKLSKLLVKYKGDIHKSLEALSIIMLQDYKDIFLHGEFVENSAMTLKIRKSKGIGSTTPLVATGELQRRMERRVSHE